jgi:hypothetical protein
MKINNSLDVARWEKLECECDMSNETKCFPFVKCEHCRCKRCWDSVPQDNFKVNTFDEEGKVTGTKTIKEITLKRGDLIEDVIGWEWNA